MDHFLTTCLKALHQVLRRLLIGTDFFDMRERRINGGTSLFRLIHQKIPKLDAVFVLAKESLEESDRSLNVHGMWAIELLKRFDSVQQR